LLSSSSLSTSVSISAGPPGTSLLTQPQAQPVNPFHLQNAVAKPSINEIREKQQQQTNSNVGGGFGGGGSSTSTATRPTNNPWSPVKEHHQNNQNQFGG